MKKNENIENKINCFINYKEKVALLNNFNNKPVFSAQSKLEPTILEEFLFHLFREISDNKVAVGGVKAYTNLYFSPKDFTSFKKKNFIKINEKDQDFAIYKRVRLQDETEKIEIAVPIVSIECKTYLDKTMLEGSIATAEKIKAGNPHCKFFIVTETYEVDYKVDPSTSRIDNIFVLKKGGRADRNNKIDKNVMIKLYEEIQRHLSAGWRDIEQNIKNKGSVF